MFSLDKARSTLKKWLLRNNSAAPRSVAEDIPKDSLNAQEPGESDARILEFLEDLRNSSQEWLGRVRLINLHSIRERTGQNWPKVKQRVEILSEKIIQDAITSRDRYLSTRDSQFLVFFADATPEESRIRCFAIVEAIHEKLFGFEERDPSSSLRVAECHVVHRDDLATEWNARDGGGNVRPGEWPAALQSSFRKDPELLDRADIIACGQTAIDSIISQGIRSRDVTDLAPLLVRLKLLSTGLRTLEPALAASKSVPICVQKVRRGNEALDDEPRPGPIGRDVLGTIWEDMAELLSVLDVSQGRSCEDLAAALTRLQQARAERAAARLHVDTRGPHRHGNWRQFEYVPVFRSVSKGERILQGIYRVGSRGPDGGARDAAASVRDHAAMTEMASLEHAIQYLFSRESLTRFLLMVSVNVETLRSPHCQRQYSTILRSAQLRVKRHLVVEVTGYTDADDTIGVQRAINELRVHSHAVFLTAANGDFTKLATQCKKLGVEVLGINIAPFDNRHLLIARALSRLASAGERLGVPIFVDGISDVPTLAKAIACGATYICAPTLRPPVDAPNEVNETTLEDLYAGI